MKKTTILTLVLLASPGLSGQDLPSITTDPIVKSTEFYSGTYDKERNENGTSGTYWLLDNDFNLYFGRTGHHPPSNVKKRVGSWKLQQDSVIFTVTRPKSIGLSDPTIFRYKLFQFEWTTNTGFMEKNTGEALILKSIAIVLSDNSRVNAMNLMERLNKYVKDNFTPVTLNQEQESMRDWDNHNQVENLVRQYCNKVQIVVGIQRYRNNQLWIR